jgi:hypothetical protein
MFMLSVKIHQQSTRFAEAADGHHLTVDESAGSSLHPNLAAQEQVSLVIEFNARLSQASCRGAVGIYFEESFDTASVSTTANQLGRYGGSKDRMQGADENRFARTRFTRDHRKAGAQLDIDGFDQSKTVDSESPKATG